MKTLIPILIGLLVVGCGKQDNTGETKSAGKVEAGPFSNIDTIAATPESVVGTYEGTGSFVTNSTWVLKPNGVANMYIDGELHFMRRWSISDAGEVIVDGDRYKVTSNGDLLCHDRMLETIFEYKRVKDTKPTSEKKETPSKGDDKNSTTAKPVKELTLEEKVVGEYESIYNGKTYKRVFQENGIVEWYVNGRKRAEYKLEIVNGEIRAAFGSEYKDIYRINADRSIIHIAYISDGEREDFPKEEQVTYKRIK